MSRSLAILYDALPSLQRLAAEYGDHADPDHIAQTLKKLRKDEPVSFGEIKELHYPLCLAIARSDDWKLTGEVIGALLEVRDVTREAMRTTVEREGKLVQFEAAESLHQQHLADFHNPDAPLRGFFGPQRNGFLWAVLKDPVATARAIQVMERRGMDTSEIKRLAAKSPEDREKEMQDAMLLEALGEKEFSRQAVAATRKAAARWAIKALGYFGLALLLLWIAAHFYLRTP